jgi:hypothetical protein
MGAAAANFEERVREGISNFSPKVNHWLGDLTNDPERTLVAVGTSGMSEMLRETGIAVQSKLADQAKANAPQMGAPPEAPKADENDDLVKDGEEKRKAGGRASTILTGKRGLTGEAKTARRTLLGV